MPAHDYYAEARQTAQDAAINFPPLPGEEKDDTITRFHLEKGIPPCPKSESLAASTAWAEGFADGLYDAY